MYINIMVALKGVKAIRIIIFDYHNLPLFEAKIVRIHKFMVESEGNWNAQGK